HRFHTISNHFYISRPIFLHRAAFDGWPADLQAAMRAAVAEAVTFQRGLAGEEDRDARRAIEAQGCEIVELTGDEHRQFAAAVQPLLKEAKTTYGTEMFGMVGA